MRGQLEIWGRATAAGAGSRNRAQAEWKARRGSKAESPFGRDTQEDSLDSGYKARGPLTACVQRSFREDLGKAFPD